MRIAFGLLSLVVVLSVVGLLVKRSLSGLSSAPSQASSTSTHDATVRVPQELPRKVAEDVGKLMQQAPRRPGDAER